MLQRFSFISFLFKPPSQDLCVLRTKFMDIIYITNQSSRFIFKDVFIFAFFIIIVIYFRHYHYRYHCYLSLHYCYCYYYYRYYNLYVIFIAIIISLFLSLFCFCFHQRFYFCHYYYGYYYCSCYRINCWLYFGVFDIFFDLLLLQDIIIHRFCLFTSCIIVINLPFIHIYHSNPIAALILAVSLWTVNCNIKTIFHEI